jgi:hypothetical protein
LINSGGVRLVTRRALANCARRDNSDGIELAMEKMMLRKMPVLLVPLVLMSPALSHAASSAPSNYDECILDAMRGVSSDVAARAIIDSCRNLFPEPVSDAPPQAASLPPITPAVAEEAVTPATPAAAPRAAEAPAPLARDPLDTASARSLTAEELARLSARAKVFGSTYRVTVENGNPDLTVTEVTIAVWDEGDLGASREDYSEVTQIAPQTSAMVKYVVHYRGDETGWNWDVVAARGVEGAVAP